MSSAVKKAIIATFDAIVASKSNLKKVLNPSEAGAGQRIFPPKTAKHDESLGIRLNKSEGVSGKPNVVRVNVQANSNAKNKTIREMAQKNSHAVLATAEVDTTQDATEENALKLRDELIKDLQSK